METQPTIADQETPTLARKIMQFFLVRLLLAVIFLGVALAIHMGQKAIIEKCGVADMLVFRIYRPVTGIVLVYLAYYFFVKWIEKRSLSELALAGWLKEFGQGAGLGFVLISVQVVVLAIFGVYRVSGAALSLGVMEIISISLIAALIEELVMRGILFRILEEGLGSWIAIVLSSLVFGFGHAGNEGATVISSLAITLEAGLLLALAYMYTRRLWLVIGLHFAWNATLGGLYGMTVSGVEVVNGILQSSLDGPVWVTGGAFGLEAGITALLACLGLSALLLRKLLRTDGIVAAPWTARRKAAAQAP